MTQGGIRLFQRAQLIVQQARLALAEARQLQGADEGSVALGVTPLVALTVLPQAVAAFRRRYRKVELKVTEGLEGIVLPGVRQGHLDFGVMIVAGDRLGEDLSFVPWFTGPNTVAARDGHPLAQARGLAELAEQEWVATSFGTHGMGATLLHYFARSGLQPPARLFRCQSVITTLALVRTTDLITFMPRELLACPECQGIRAIPVEPPPPASEFGLVMRAEVPLTPVAEAFADILEDLALRRFGPEARRSRAKAPPPAVPAGR
jgi:DNA-binding transcriptional LysR family regulator